MFKTATNGIFSVIIAVSNAITEVFKFIFAYFTRKHDEKKKKKEKLDQLNQDLGNVCDNGSISELIDIT